MTEFDKVIPPGGVGKITASLDTTHFKGSVSKSVTVKTNDPVEPTFALHLAVDVVAALIISPNDTPMLRGRPKDLKPLDLIVASINGKPFDITRVSTDQRLNVSVKAPGDLQTPRPQGTDAAGAAVAPALTGSSRYLVTVAAKPDIPIGQSSAMVTFFTSHPSAPRLAMRVGLVVLGELEVVPERLLLRPEQATQQVKIRKREGSGLAILGVESSDPDLRASSTTETEGRAYDVTVQYTGKAGRGPVNARVTVKTNDPNQSAIVIPVTGNL